MDVKQDIVPDRSALAKSNVGNMAIHTRYGGGRGRSRGGNCGGGRASGRGHGSPGVGRGYGGLPNTDCDELYCTHCGRYRHTIGTCWDLNGKPWNVSAPPAEVEIS